MRRRLKQSRHYAKVSNILKFNFGIDANRLSKMKKPDLVLLCAEASDDGLSVEETLLYCFGSMVEEIIADGTQGQYKDQIQKWNDYVNDMARLGEISREAYDDYFSAFK